MSQGLLSSIVYQAGKLANVAKEMTRMNIDVLGVLEKFWKDTGDFRYHLTNNEDFWVIFAGGNEHRKVVAFVMRGVAKDSIINYSLKSERIIIVRLSSKPKKFSFVKSTYQLQQIQIKRLKNFVNK